MKRQLFQIALIVLVTGYPLYAQVSVQGVELNQADTLTEDEIRFRMKRDMRKHLEEFQERRLLNLQKEGINELVQYTAQVEVFLRKGFDSVSIRKNAQALEESFNKAISISLFERDNFMSFRDMNATHLLLNEMITQLEFERRKVLDYNFQINRLQSGIDSLATDSTVYVLPRSNQEFALTIELLTESNSKIRPTVKKLANTRNEVFKLENSLARLGNEMELARHELIHRKELLATKIYDQEIPLLWQPLNEIVSFKYAVWLSLFGAQQSLKYFIINNLGKISLLLVSTAILWLFSRWRTQQNTLAIGTNTESFGHVVLRFPLRSSLFMAFTFGQFLFLSSPFAFQAIIWILLTGVLMTYLAREISLWDSQTLIPISALLVAVIFINLILKPTTFERWAIVLLSSLGIVLGYRMLKLQRKKERPVEIFPPLFLVFIWCEIFALLAIVFGRFNLSKTLLTAGCLTIVSGIFLATAVFIFDKFCTRIIGTFDDENQKHLKNKLYETHQFLKRLLKYLIPAALIILFIRNFYFYNSIVLMVTDFLYEKRTLGAVVFSVRDIALFILIIIISIWLSSLLSFFGGNAGINQSPLKSKGGIQNWVLIFRLAIIMSGFFIALIAVGIPIDRITIILGALGVGIGFGLQSIANNIVSGIILAIERPVEIGDQIEIPNKAGRVVSIGVRSTKIQSYDGAEVIIPNADILNQHVVNWTLSNNHRRVELLLSVEYGSDLTVLKLQLEELIRNCKYVDTDPAPQVLMQSFNESAIALQLLFWTDVSNWMKIKSEIILEIDRAFKEAGIKIPFPKLDVHIRGDKIE